MRSLSLSETTGAAQATTATSPESAASAANEAKNWSRVVDKKEQKRKLAETALKVNSVLKQEEQPSPELVPISPRAMHIKEATPPPPSANSSAECSTPLSKSYNLDLSSLMPQSAKLSQKQRKRLSSESQSWRAPVELNSSAPVPVPNAWGVTASSPNSSYAEPFSSPAAAATGSSADPTSFANMMRGGQVASPPEPGNSFSQILADERRQRESYERMRNKSLVHTQIEEAAIAELREFYNVDNIDDETITIERKSRPSNINFTTWLKHWSPQIVASTFI